MTDQQPHERPRPKYGELAPEGWKPPQQPAPGGRDQQHLHWHDPHWHDHGRRGASGGKRTIPVWDRNLTIVLLVVGLFGLYFSISLLQALPASMAMLFKTEGLGSYTPPADLAGIITAASVCQGAVWLLALGLSILLMVRSRFAFYIPLVAGAVAAILLFVFIGVVVAGDPTLVHYYNGS